MPEFKLGSELQLPIAELPNTQNKELFEALKPIHQSLNLLAGMVDGRVLREGLNAATSPFATLRTSGLNRFTCPANVNLSQGQPVYFAPNVGVLNAYPANALFAQFLAMGYCSQPGGVLAGQYGEFTPFMGVNSLLSGLSIGATYYLTDAGGYSITPGSLYQRLGVALSSTALLFNCSMVNEGETRLGVISISTSTPGLQVIATHTSAYSRVGRWVTAQAYFTLRNNTGGFWQTVQLDGLPFFCSASHYGFADLYYYGLGTKIYAYAQAGAPYVLAGYNPGFNTGDTPVMLHVSYPI